MTENPDWSTRSNRSGQESQTVGREAEWTRTRWESLAADPRPCEDLGYDLAEWEEFETLDGTDQTMFLPSDESDLKDAAFIVVQNEVVVDLEERC